MDKLTKEQREKNMKAVKSKDSKIELKLRKALWDRGYRYRKNFAKITGKPDVVLLSSKIAIFCDSEFWHGYNWEDKNNEIKSNRDFWIKKIELNMKRDKKVNEQLEKEGWIVLRFWGKEIEKNLDKCIELIENTIEVKKRFKF
jgi:DNA mismatch endonuclease Vsr